MRLATLGATAPNLPASGVSIGGLGPLGLTHSCLNLLQFLFRLELQLNFSLVTLLDHVIQGLTPREAHELPHVIPQHSVISFLPHPLIRNILWEY